MAKKIIQNIKLFLNIITCLYIIINYLGIVNSRIMHIKGGMI